MVEGLAMAGYNELLPKGVSECNAVDDDGEGYALKADSEDPNSGGGGNFGGSGGGDIEDCPKETDGCCNDCRGEIFPAK